MEKSSRGQKRMEKTSREGQSRPRRVKLKKKKKKTVWRPREGKRNLGRSKTIHREMLESEKLLEKV